MILACATALPLVVAVAWYLRIHAENHVREALETSLSLSRETGVRIDDQIASIRQLLWATTSAVQDDLANADALDARLKQIQSGLLPYISTISVLAPDGRMLASATVPPASRRNVNFSDRSHFRQALASRSFAVGPVVRARLAKRPWIVTATTPLLASDGSVPALVSVSLDLASIQTLLASDRKPPGTVVAVLDENNRVLAHAPHPEDHIGQDWSARPGVEESRRRGLFSGESSGEDGSAFLVSITAATEVPWLVIVGVPKNLALASVREQTRHALLYVLFVLLLGVALAWVLSRRIALPIHELSDDAARLAAGELAHRSAVTGEGEVGTLAHNFNHMAETLERSLALARKSEARLSGIITSAMDAIITIDEGYRIILANRAAEKMFGYETADLIGQSVNRLIPGRFHHDHDRQIERFGTTGITRRVKRAGEIVGVRANGEEFPIEASISQVGKSPDKLYTVVLRDITERKQSEHQLRQHAEEMRNLSRRLSEVEERERREIHRELHDRVGANLTALKLDLDILASGASRDMTTLPERLNKARALLAETVVEIRDVMTDLRPAALDDYGLVAALRAYAAPYAARLGMDVSVSGPDNAPRLPLALETALFRIAQEALNNIAKHAKARKVAIEVNTRDGDLTLTLDDDGVGFDPAQANTGRLRWGLTIMRERALAAGAAFAIESAPGKGTRIVVAVPGESA